METSHCSNVFVMFSDVLMMCPCPTFAYDCHLVLWIFGLNVSHFCSILLLYLSHFERTCVCLYLTCRAVTTHSLLRWDPRRLVSSFLFALVSESVYVQDLSLLCISDSEEILCLYSWFRAREQLSLPRVSVLLVQCSRSASLFYSFILFYPVTLHYSLLLTLYDRDIFFCILSCFALCAILVYYSLLFNSIPLPSIFYLILLYCSLHCSLEHSVLLYFSLKYYLCFLCILFCCILLLSFLLLALL